MNKEQIRELEYLRREYDRRRLYVEHAMKVLSLDMASIDLEEHDAAVALYAKFDTPEPTDMAAKARADMRNAAAPVKPADPEAPEAQFRALCRELGINLAIVTGGK